MMKHEFEKIAGYEVTTEDYNNIIEPMYMATDLSKEEFVKTLNRKQFEHKAKETEENKEIRNRLNKKAAEYKEAIAYNNKMIDIYTNYLADEIEENWIREYKNDIKRLKDEIKGYKNRIKEIKWVLQ